MKKNTIFDGLFFNKKKYNFIRFKKQTKLLTLKQKNL